jgi:hypothetical protein
MVRLFAITNVRNENATLQHPAAANGNSGPRLSVWLPGVLARSVALPHNALSLRRSFAPQALGAITVQGEEYIRP